MHDSVHLVAQRQKAFDEQVEKAAEGLDDEERVFYYDHYSEEHERLHDKFPQLVSASTLLMACSLFESTLTDLCKYLDGLPTQLGLPSPKKTGTKARLTLITHWEDVKGSGIIRPAAFLRKNFRIEAGRCSEWNTILGHYEVRHCLAHANGDVGLMRVNNGKQLKELLQKQPFPSSRSTILVVYSSDPDTSSQLLIICADFSAHYIRPALQTRYWVRISGRSPYGIGCVRLNSAWGPNLGRRVDGWRPNGRRLVHWPETGSWEG